jgi:hypothetical protein
MVIYHRAAIVDIRWGEVMGITSGNRVISRLSADSNLAGIGLD